jgi:hypothetical protein
MHPSAILPFRSRNMWRGHRDADALSRQLEFTYKSEALLPDGSIQLTILLQPDLRAARQRAGSRKPCADCASELSFM